MEGKKQLLTVTHWGNIDPREVRIEIAGNGNYLTPDNLAAFIRNNADRLASEILYNIPK